MATRKKHSSQHTERANKKATQAVARKRAVAKPDYSRSDLVEVRNSPIHGRGVYAVKPIKKGTRILEYVGERISHAEADRRFWKKGQDDGHTFLFVVNHKTVIDGTHDGNDARYINHRCAANCETVTEGNRIFIDAMTNIKAGEELGYDYQLTWDSGDDPEELKLYDCRCGSKNCRGTMLDKLPLDEQRRRERARRKRARLRAEAALQKITSRAGKTVKKQARK
ncbi:MAG TPA: SET domain-containing protein-lysine N-methyltransferase [Steroidobacteraceae bacterium]|nr:SET domain-containing protein-lysine N-methyltransferase [Steroidobacteraceae bacterium]